MSYKAINTRKVLW